MNKYTHKGGDAPKCDERAVVEVTMRDGDTNDGPVKDFDWSHDSWDGDILSYRFLCPAGFTPNDGKCPEHIKGTKVEIAFNDGTFDHVSRYANDWCWRTNTGRAILGWRLLEKIVAAPKFIKDPFSFPTRRQRLLLL